VTRLLSTLLAAPAAAVALPVAAFLHALAAAADADDPEL
jgi:hypothetical protein